MGPLLSAPMGASKGESPTSNLTESTAFHLTGSCKGPIEGRSSVLIKGIDPHLTVDASSTPDLSILPPWMGC